MRCLHEPFALPDSESPGAKVCFKLECTELIEGDTGVKTFAVKQNLGVRPTIVSSDVSFPTPRRSATRSRTALIQFGDLLGCLFGLRTVGVS